MGVCVAITPAPAPAQTSYTWNNFAGTTNGSVNWSDTANWTTLPTFNQDATLQFAASPLQTAGTFTASADQASVNLNGLLFALDGGSQQSVNTGGGPYLINLGVGAASTVNLVPSSTAVAPTITQNGSGSVAIGVVNGGSQAGSSLTFGGTSAATVGGTGLGAVEIGAAITALPTNGLLINFSPSAVRANNSGATLALSGANTFTGSVTLQNGNLDLANSAALGAAANPLVVNSGSNSVRVNNTPTIPNPVVLNSTLNFTTIDGGTSTWTGAWSGSAGASLRPSVGMTFNMFGAGGFTGPLVLRSLLQGYAGTANDLVYNLGSSTGGATTGSLATTSLQLFPGSRFVVTNANAASTNRLAAGTTLTMLRSSFALLANATAGNDAAETVASLTNTGMSTLIAAPATGTATGATLTVNAWTRNGNATMVFVGPNLGNAPGANVGDFVFPTNPGGATPGSTTPGTLNLAVLPYAYGNAVPTVTTNAVTSLVRWDAGTGRIVPLNTGTEYASNSTLSNATGAAGLNYRLAGAGTGGVAALKSAVSANGLVIDTNMATPPPVGVSLVGNQTLTLTGPVLSTYSGTGFPTGLSTFLPQQVAVSGLNFGSTTAYFHTPGDLWLRTPVSGSGGLVKSGENGSGQADLYLLAANSFTGGLTVNAGRVMFTADAQLGAAGGPVTLNSAGNGGLFFTQNPFYDSTPVANPTVGRPLTLGPAGGTLGAVLQNNTLTYSGPITNTAADRSGLQINSSGVVNLSNPSNNFFGDVVVRSGTVVVAADATLGDSSNRVLLGGVGSVGVFQPAPGYTSTSRDFLTMGNIGPSSIFTNGVDFTINGTIAQAQAYFGGTGLVKGGLGTLTLTAANTVGGAITVGDTGIRVSAPTQTQLGGTLRLAGANGALPFASGVAVNDTAALTLDNTAAVNSDRLGIVGVSLSGGRLNLIGNAGADTTELLGTISAGANGIVTVNQPTSAGNNRVTTLSATAIGTSSGNLFVRGTNLGAGSGDRGRLLVTPANTTTALTLANGIVVGGFAATSDTAAGPSDLLAASLVTPLATPNQPQYSLVPLTTYGSLASPGATVNANQAGGVFTLTGPTSLNALRIGAGGGLDLNGQTLTLGTTVANAQAGTILSAGGSNAGIVGGVIDFGAQSPRVVTTDPLTIGTAGNPTSVLSSTTTTLYKSGPGTLTLFGTAATTLASTGTLSGQVIVGEGTLVLGNATALGRATLNSTSVAPIPNVLPSVQTLQAGTLDLSQLSAAPVRINTYAGSGTLALGNTQLNTGVSSSSIQGSVTGSAASKFIVGLAQADVPFNTFGGGGPALTGDNSGFLGQWVVLRGTLNFQSNLSFGTGTSPVQFSDSASNGSTGSVTLRIDANLTVPFPRDVVVPAGGFALPTFLVGNGSNASMTGSLTLGKTAAVSGTPGSAGTFTFAGPVSGAGQLQLGTSVFGASGNVAFATANPGWSGGLLMNTGTSNSAVSSIVGVGADTSLGTGSLTLGQFAGLLRADNGPRTLGNAINVYDSSPSAAFTTSFGVTGVNDLTLTGNVRSSQSPPFNSVPPAVPATPFTHTLNLNVISQGTTTFAGTVGNGSAFNFGVTKNGPGLVAFTGANTYTGDTVVNAGTVRLGSPTALGLGGRQAVTGVAGAVSVNSGAVLDLNGQAGVNKPITLAGGTLTNSGASAASVAGGAVSSLTLGGTLTGFATVPTVTLAGGGGTGAAATALLGLAPASFTFTPLTQGGSGYSAAPTVTVSGGGGGGAEAVATLGVTAQTFTITNGGSGYVTAPSVTISGAQTSGATTATATAILTGGVVTGITIVNPGAGYLFAPTITFGAAPSGGTTATGIGNATNFRVGSVVLTNPGGGYSSAPTFSFAGGGGSGATVTTNATNFALGVQLTAPGSGYTSAPTVTFGTGTATATANLSGVTLAAGTTSTIGGGPGNITINAPVTGSGALVVAGPGTVTFTGNNTFTGGTAVLGTAVVSGQTGANSGTGTGAVTVAAGGTLAGNGQATGAVTVNAGGTIAPGAGLGVLSVGPTVLSNNSTFRVVVASGTATGGAANSGASSTGAPGTANSVLAAGVNSITFASTLDLVIDLTGVNLSPLTPYSFVVATGSNISPSGAGPTQIPFNSATFLAAGIPIDPSSVTLVRDPAAATVYLNFTPVPEPVSILGVAAAGLAGLHLRRRKLILS